MSSIFACLVTKICLILFMTSQTWSQRRELRIPLESMKSNAQLRFEDQREAESPPPTSSVQADPVATSSSTPTAPPASAMLSRILDTVLSIQQEVNTMSVRVDQNNINIR
jgi:hypothetical protein